MTMKADYGTQVDEEVTICEDDRHELEVMLAEKGKEGGWGNVAPVWVGNDEGGIMKLKGADRWRNYAERGELLFMILRILTRPWEECILVDISSQPLTRT
jgi:hypothetical protein